MLDAGDREPAVVVGRTRRPNRARAGPGVGREVGGADPDRALPEQVVEAAAREDAAVVDDRDAVADALDLGQQVRVQEDRRAGVAGPRMIARTSARPTGSSADVGSSRITSAGEPSSATPSPSRCCIPFENVPTRSSARSREADRVERRARSRRPRSSPGRRARSGASSTSRAREPRLVAEQLREVADPPPRGAVAERRAQDRRRCRRSDGEAEQQLDRGRLAGAVRARGSRTPRPAPRRIVRSTSASVRP